MSTALASAAAGEGAGGTSGGAGSAGNTGGSDGGSGAAGGGTSAPNAGDAAGSGHSGAAGASASWRDTLPDDIKGSPLIVGFQDVASLTKSFINAQTLIGRKGAIPPADWSKATPEEKQGFFQAVGVPSLDKYEVKLPEGVKIADGFLKGFKEVAAKEGILPHQANAALKWFSEVDTAHQKTQAQAAQAQDLKNLGALEQEWGGKEGYTRNLQAINFFVKEKGSPELAKVLSSDARIANNVPLLKLLYECSKFLTPDKLKEGGLGDGAPSHTEIQGQLNEIMANGKDNGFFSKAHPNHKIIVDKVASLRKMLTGGT